MNEDSLKKRYAVKLLSNIVNGIVNIILVAIVPKALGTVAYGQFVYIQNFFIQITSFLDAGTSLAFFTKLSAKNSRKELTSFYFLFSFFLLLILLLFTYFIYIYNYSSLLMPEIPEKYILLGVWFGFFTWFTQIFIKISDAYALTVSIELIKIIHKFLSLFLLILIINFFLFDLSLYFYFHYLSLISFIVVISYFLAKKGILSKALIARKLDFKSLFREFFDFCSPLVMLSVIGLLTGFFDIWLLQKVAGSEQTGFYGLAYSIVAMSFLFTSAMTPIITREFSKAYNHKDLLEMRRLFFRYIPMLYSVAAYFGVFIAFQSENLLLIFTDESFKNVYWVLVIMSFYPLHQTYGQLSGSVFYTTDQTRLYTNIGIISMCFGTIITFIFIYVFKLEAVGLALKMIIVQLIAVNIQLYYNAKFLNFKMFYFLSHQVSSLLFFAVAGFSSSFVNFTSPLINFLTSGILYTLLVVVFTYFYPNVFAITQDEIKQNLTKINDIFKINK